MKKLNTSPLVSVILPVFNAAEFLSDAINSIMRQTYKNIEVVCVDDHSRDGSYKILRDFAKKYANVRVYRLPGHSGASAAANLAVRKAKGSFIARMDADDVMYPDRIAKQVRFLQKNRDIIAVGTQCERIDEYGRTLGIKTFPLDHASIHTMIFRSVPIQQPTLLVNRKKLPASFHWYNRSLKIGEDYDLYYRLMKYGKLANMPDVLLRYREHPNNLTLSSQKETFWYITRSRFIAVTQYGYIPNPIAFLHVLAQTLLVLVLPEKILYPLHIQTRSLFFKSAYN